MEPKKQENIDKTETETIDEVKKSAAELQLQSMMQRMEQMEIDKQGMEAKLEAMQKNMEEEKMRMIRNQRVRILLQE